MQQVDEEQIRERAYQLYLARSASGTNGNGSQALDDWLEAEQEMRLAEDKAVDDALEDTFPASDPLPY